MWLPDPSSVGAYRISAYCCFSNRLQDPCLRFLPTFERVSVNKIFSLLLLVLVASHAYSAPVYQENISKSGGIGLFQNYTPHSSVDTHIYTYIDPIRGGAVETVDFNSDPIPYLAAKAEAWMGSSGRTQFSHVYASLQYEFSILGPANGAVPIKFLGLFQIGNGNFLSYSTLDAGITTSGWDYSRAVGVGFHAQCDGTTISARCFTRHNNAPSPGSTLLVEMEDVGFTPSPWWGSDTAGTFSGVILANTDASGRARGVVSLNVFVSARAVLTNGGSAISTAFVDPALWIDPSYLEVNPSAQLFLTPGVGNQMPVPEPSQLVLTALGLGIGILVMRRKIHGA